MAPMSGLILALTVLVFPLPLLFLAISTLPGPQRPAMAMIAGLLVVAWAGIWLWARPSRFELSPAGLRIVFPLRVRSVPAASLASAEIVDAKQFRAVYRYGIRIGAGGLFGAFGLLATKKGMLQMYTSRHDRFVLVHLREGCGRDLLISPEDPERFIAAIVRTVAAPA